MGNLELETYYAGPGHTKDNIVVWFPKARVLYGGCLIKSWDSEDLGYVKEASLEEWPKTMNRLLQRYPNPAFIIPGHGDWTNRRSIIRTLELLQQDKQQKKSLSRKSLCYP